MSMLKTKLKESFFAVFPLTAIVVVLGLFVIDLSNESLIGFVVASILLVIGMSLFTLGVDIAIMPIGELIGSRITRTKKIWFILSVTFITALIVTISEPGLTVLGAQLSEAINPWVLLIVVGIGVGIFLVISVIRTVLDIALSKILYISYGLLFLLVFLLVILNKQSFIGVAFDAGGAVTGAITVPFIMAFGIGIASIKGHDESSDSFGLICLGVVGSIILITLLGLFSKGNLSIDTDAIIQFEMNDFTDIIGQTMIDVLIPLSIILGLFTLLQIFLIKTPLRNYFKILIGSLYTYIGLVIFLIGANAGFTTIGSEIGYLLGQLNEWLLLPVGLLSGFFLVVSEPAVQVLGSRIEEISDGRIKKKSLKIFLMSGVGVAIGLSMIRIITGLSIWWVLIPGYIIAFALTLKVPKIYTAVAFDSGGIASGPMTASFLLPLALGACNAVGGNILFDAFGLIAFVSLSPLITIQFLGLISEIKAKNIPTTSNLIADDYEIIELEV